MYRIFELPDDISELGYRIDDAFWLTYHLTLAIFLVVMAVLIGILVVYRSRPGHKALYTRGEGGAHVAMTVGLVALVFFGLDLQCERASHDILDALEAAYPRGPDAVRIEVQAEQFAWNFRYPGPNGVFGDPDDVVYPVLHFPVGRPVVFELHTKDVIHSFFLPQFRLKQDVVPGLTTSLWVKAVKPGRYEVACAELCGNGHTRMRADYFAEPQEDFDKFLAERYAKDATGSESPADNWGWPWRGR